MSVIKNSFADSVQLLIVVVFTVRVLSERGVFIVDGSVVGIHSLEFKLTVKMLLNLSNSITSIDLICVCYD